MNARHLSLTLIAAVAAALPLAAQADGDFFGDGVKQAGKTRAEVQAELAAFRKNPVFADGWKSFNDGYFVYVGQPAGTLGKTRAQVEEELAEFRKNPVHADGWKSMNDGYIVYVGQPAGTVGKTRAQVQQELAAFRKNPVSADGWKSVGDGGHFVYVGRSPANTSGVSTSMSGERQIQ